MTYPFIRTLRQNWTAVPAVVRRNLILDFNTAVFYGVFLAGIINFVPVVARRLGANPFLLSLIVAAPAIGNLIAVFGAHYLQQRRKLPFMVAAWSIGRGLFLLMAFVTAPVPFVLIVVVHWLIVSLPVTGYVEIMRAIYPDAMRGRAMAFVRVGFTACATVMIPLFGQLLDGDGPDDGRQDEKADDRVEQQQSQKPVEEFALPRRKGIQNVNIYFVAHGTRLCAGCPAPSIFSAVSRFENRKATVAESGK